jgi:hypothetical protein
MKTVTFTRELYLNWSNEDLRKRYEFLMEREQSLGPQLLHNLEIVSEILMEREAPKRGCNYLENPYTEYIN